MPRTRAAGLKGRGLQLDAGLLRWPELRTETAQTRIHQLTEYFLVGSFVSWLTALGALLLLAG